MNKNKICMEKTAKLLSQSNSQTKPNKQQHQCLLTLNGEQILICLKKKRENKHFNKTFEIFKNCLKLF